MSSDTLDLVPARSFRRALGHFASGVTVVTLLAEDGTPRGLTVSAFSSLSLDPPLILTCVGKSSESHDALARAGVPFAVNVLSAGQADVAATFAGKGGAAKFAGIPYRSGGGGAPLLDGAHAWLECSVSDVVDGGDHTVVIGAVVAADTSGAPDPLVHHRGRFVAVGASRPPAEAARAWARLVGDRTPGEFLAGLGFDPADRGRANAEAAVAAYLARRRASARDLPGRLPAARPEDAAALVAWISG